MWAEKSSRVADARSYKRPLQSTSKPATVAQSSNVQETDAVTVITSFDAAKIRKDAEPRKEDTEIIFEEAKNTSERPTTYEKLDMFCLTERCLTCVIRFGLILENAWRGLRGK